MSDENPQDPDVIVPAKVPPDAPATDPGAEAAPVPEAAPAAEAAPVAEAATEETPDYMFRAQLAMTSFFAANGRYMGWVAAAGLGSVLAWGLWTMWQEHSAETDFGAIASVDYRMPKPDPMSQYGLAPADDPTDAGRKADLEEGARRFEAAAQDASGTAAVYGYIKAAEAWQRAGNAPSRLAALKAAYALGGGDLPAWSAGTAYAGALADAGSNEEALGVFRDLAGRTQGFYAQQALLSLAAGQLDLGKNDDAKQTIAEYKTRFPTAPQERALALEARAAAVPGAPVPAGAPAPAGSAG